MWPTYNEGTLRQMEVGGESFLVIAIRDSTRWSQSEAGLNARVQPIKRD